MKKGQAAMEFLMTYGWAILVVLAAIGALAYFGVLSPDRFMPSKCLVTGGFSCVEFKLDGTNDAARIYLQNNLGVDADYINVTVMDKNSVACTVAGGNLPNVVNGGKTPAINVTGCSLTSSTFKSDITITYRKSGETEEHTATGSLSGKME
jgi:hypothetical protein